MWRAPGEAWLLVQLAVCLVWLACVLRFATLPVALRWFSPRVRVRNQVNALTPARLAARVDQLLCLQVWVFRPVCWKRALLLQRFLRRAGWETRVVFGVRRDGVAGLDGHAWLELDGQPFLEHQPPDYQPTLSYP